MRAWAIAGAVAVLVLSGCLGPAAAPPGPSSHTPPGCRPAGPCNRPGAGERLDGPTEPATPPPAGTRPATQGANGTTPPTPPAPPAPDAPWPELAAATLRPGVRATSAAGQCTTNFVFRSPDNASLYLGLAAHCVDGLAPEARVEIEGASRPGALAYSSWRALGLECRESAAPGVGCTNASFAHDFALVRIHPDDRPRVHPAVLGFGGPTRLANVSQLRTLDRVLAYGNSDLRGGVDATNRHEGWVTQAPRDGAPQFFVLTASPGIPGDSGSGVLTRDGAAAGVVVTLGATGENGVVGLPGALALAQAKAGLTVDLATWPLLDDGLLP